MMYRCTECKSIYEQKPDFCDCGNDEFEEIIEEQEQEPVYEESSYDDDYDEDDYEEPEVPKKKKKLSKSELRAIAEEKLDKKKSMIAAIVFVVLALLVIVLPPYPQKKSDKIAESAEPVQYTKIPAITTYWDNTLPSYARLKDKYYNLPVLNKQLGSLSPVLNEYLKSVGDEFSRKWDFTLVEGDGEARIALVIDPDGKLEYKQLVTKSNNESLDDSVLLLLSKINDFDIPPDDYKGEKIILSFKIKDGKKKVYFP